LEEISVAGSALTNTQRTRRYAVSPTQDDKKSRTPPDGVRLL